jgi:hypothetical protein
MVCFHKCSSYKNPVKIKMAQKTMSFFIDRWLYTQCIFAIFRCGLAERARNVNVCRVQTLAAHLNAEKSGYIILIYRALADPISKIMRNSLWESAHIALDCHVFILSFNAVEGKLV